MPSFQRILVATERKHRDQVGTLEDTDCRHLQRGETQLGCNGIHGDDLARAPGDRVERPVARGGDHQNARPGHDGEGTPIRLAILEDARVLDTRSKGSQAQARA